MNTVLHDNIGALREAADLFEAIGSDDYARRVPECFNASIGGHFRHELDHYLSFLRDLASRRVDYERRDRDALLENDAAHARRRIGEVVAALEALADVPGDTALSVRIENTAEGAPDAWGASTVRRELQFLLSHTIHHHALIAINARLLGHTVPAEFGVAPSTLRFRAATGA